MIMPTVHTINVYICILVHIHSDTLITLGIHNKQNSKKLPLVLLSLNLNNITSGYPSNARIIFQLWLKDICVYVEYHQFKQRQAIQLIKVITTQHTREEVEFYMCQKKINPLEA